MPVAGFMRVPIVRHNFILVWVSVFRCGEARHSLLDARLEETFAVIHEDWINDRPET